MPVNAGLPNLANMRRWPNVGLLLAHRLRRWPTSKPTLGQRLMFAGNEQILNSEKDPQKTLNINPYPADHD